MKIRVPSVEYEMCFCCAVHTEWRFLIVILWSVVLLFKPRWKCIAFLLVRQTVSSLVWPTLNEKSQQMHFIDPLRIHMQKLKNGKSSVFVLLFPSYILILLLDVWMETDVFLQDYVQAMTGLCYDGLEGLIYLVLFSFVTALMFSSIICSVPHTWQGKR